MAIEYIRFRVDPDRRADFGSAVGRLRETPGCLEYELARGPDDLLRIVWADGGPAGAGNGFAVPAEVAAAEGRYETTPVAGPGGAAPPSLYDWAGGTDTFVRLCEAFYRRVRADELLASMFTGMDAEHARYVALWLAEVFGGPPVYTDEHGGYHHMVRKHIGKAITEAQRRRWVNLMMDAADEIGLPGDPEFRAAFASYVEWGTRLALANSQPDADPVLEAPVPRWGWGVAPPYPGP